MAGNMAAFVGLIAANAFLDDVDGVVAREYGEESTFGDALDHVVDILITLGMVQVYVKRCDGLKRPWLTAFLVAVGAMTVSSQGCVEKTKGVKSQTSGFMAPLCVRTAQRVVSGPTALIFISIAMALAAKSPVDS